MNSIHKLNAEAQPASTDSLRRLRATCVHCCQDVLRRLEAVKDSVQREFGRAMAGYEQLLKAAVNEAEAVAWQTPYPHLLFPALAEEKAAEVQHWAVQQRAIRQGTRSWRPAT